MTSRSGALDPSPATRSADDYRALHKNSG